MLPVWNNQLAEIRADVFASQLCGVSSVNRLLKVLEQNETEFLASLSSWNRFCLIYNKEFCEHPNPHFRYTQIQKLDKITFWYRIRHYLRLLAWFLTFKGFYGQNIIFSAGTNSR